MRSGIWLRQRQEGVSCALEGCISWLGAERQFPRWKGTREVVGGVTYKFELRHDTALQASVAAAVRSLLWSAWKATLFWLHAI